jgi:hypothetical protein
VRKGTIYRINNNAELGAILDFTKFTSLSGISHCSYVRPANNFMVISEEINSSN